MTTTPATQALLPVTPEDRGAAAKWLRGVHSIYLALWIEGAGEAPEWAESRNPDDYSLVQAFASHRQSRQLPGDVDPDELLDLIDDAISDSFDEEWNSRMGARHIVGALEHEGLAVVPLAALAASSHPASAGDEGLLTAAIGLRDDLLSRAEWDDDVKVVCAGAGAWFRFCEAIDRALSATPAQEGTETSDCAYCGAQVVLMGADYLNQVAEALDKVGAPRKSPDGLIHYGITDRIAALSPAQEVDETERLPADDEMGRFIFAWFNECDPHEMMDCLEEYDRRAALATDKGEASRG